MDEYQKRGASFIDLLDGFFLVVILDRSSRRVLVAGNRYGVYALFVCRKPDRNMLSDSVESICRHLDRVHLDLVGVIELIDIAQVLGNKTHFQEIKKNPPINNPGDNR